jgi:hypothetical protein
MKNAIEYYIESLDNYRKDPNAQHRDLLIEAEDELRNSIGNTNYYDRFAEYTRQGTP